MNVIVKDTSLCKRDRGKVANDSEYAGADFEVNIYSNISYFARASLFQRWYSQFLLTLYSEHELFRALVSLIAAAESFH